MQEQSDQDQISSTIEIKVDDLQVEDQAQLLTNSSATVENECTSGKRK